MTRDFQTRGDIFVIYCPFIYLGPASAVARNVIVLKPFYRTLCGQHHVVNGLHWDYGTMHTLLLLGTPGRQVPVVLRSATVVDKRAMKLAYEQTKASLQILAKLFSLLQCDTHPGSNVCMH